MLNFYMTPGSCATGIHILLEELELVFSANLVNLVKGDQHQPEFRKINPKGTIPVLVLDDGTALTSFTSIAWWLANHYPKKQLLPDDLVQQAQVLEVLSYCVYQIHGQGFTRIFTPQHYRLPLSEDQSQDELIAATGKGIIEEGFGWIAQQLAQGGPLPLGKTLSVADAALFYVEFWADKTDIALPDACVTHYQAMLQRPAVRQVLAEEGYRI